jgi:uncharacterized protein (DUF2141 family)
MSNAIVGRFLVENIYFEQWKTLARIWTLCIDDYEQYQSFRQRVMRESVSAFLLLLLFAAPSIALAESSSVGRIEVLIDNVRSANGVVGVALFNAKKGFPDKSTMAIEGRSVPAGKRCKVIFENVPYGAYAISVLHDENGNGKMDKGFLGIPKEGFGTSNNPEIKMGPPSFSDSRFDLMSMELTLNIDMKYLRKPDSQDR